MSIGTMEREPSGGDLQSIPVVETIIIPEDRLPNPDTVRSLGSVSRDDQQMAHRISLHEDLPRQNERIVVIARDENGAPSAAAIAVVSQELPAAASVKRLKANKPEAGLAVIGALQAAVAQRFEGQEPTVHVTEFAATNYDQVLDDLGAAEGTHAYFGPGRMLRSK